MVSLETFYRNIFAVSAALTHSLLARQMVIELSKGSGDKVLELVLLMEEADADPEKIRNIQYHIGLMDVFIKKVQNDPLSQEELHVIVKT